MICPKCKWQYPPKYEKTICRFCGTPLPTVMCKKCNMLKERSPGTFLCKDCKAAQRHEEYIKGPFNREWYAEYRQDEYNSNLEAATKKWNDWKSRVSKLNYKQFKDNDWYTACKYFRGCALCNSDDIDAKAYFVPFKQGGKYTPWNIIPLCEYCSTRYSASGNPFVALDRRLNDSIAKVHGRGKDKLENVIKYLQVLVEEEEKCQH